MVTAPRRRRLAWPWVAGAAAVALVVFVLVWFQPQKLFIDERVDEALPSSTGSPTTSPATTTPTTAATATTAGTVSPATTPTTARPPTTAPATTVAPAPAATAPAGLVAGTFVSLDHGTSGTVRVLDLGDGSRVVRLEDLDTDNGPDLYLYLSTNAAGGSEQAFDDDYVNLGRLKGNLGNQNYDLPAGTDLSRYRSVVIWCDRFNSAFGAADLAPA